MFPLFLQGWCAEAPGGLVGLCCCRAVMGGRKQRSSQLCRDAEEATAPLHPACGYTSLLPPDFGHFFWSQPGLWISEGILSCKDTCRVRMAGKGFSVCLFIYLFVFLSFKGHQPLNLSACAGGVSCWSSSSPPLPPGTGKTLKMMDCPPTQTSDKLFTVRCKALHWGNACPPWKERWMLSGRAGGWDPGRGRVFLGGWGPGHPGASRRVEAGTLGWEHVFWGNPRECWTSAACGAGSPVEVCTYIHVYTYTSRYTILSPNFSGVSRYCFTMAKKAFYSHLPTNCLISTIVCTCTKSGTYKKQYNPFVTKYVGFVPP